MKIKIDPEFAEKYKLIPLGLNNHGQPKRPLIPNWQNITKTDLNNKAWGKAENFGIVLGKQPLGHYIGCIDVDTTDVVIQKEIIDSLGLTTFHGIEHSISGKLHIFFIYNPEKTETSTRKYILENGDKIELYFKNREIAFGFLFNNEPNPLEDERFLPRWDNSWFDVLESFAVSKDKNEEHELLTLIKKVHEKGYISGWDIDRAVIHHLKEELGYNDEMIHMFFQQIYGAEYDPKITQTMIDRLAKTNHPYRFPSLIFQIKSHDEKTAKLFQKYYSKRIKVDYLYYDPEKQVYWTLDNDKVRFFKKTEDIKIYLASLFETPPTDNITTMILAKAPKVIIEYDPTQPFGFNDEKTAYNTFQPTEFFIKLKNSTTPLESNFDLWKTLKDNAPAWHDFFEYLFREQKEDLDIFLKWIKAKAVYGKTGKSFIFRTRQGVGKDKVIKEILLYGIFGKDNIAQIIGDDITRRFNSMFQQKIWIVANEVAFDSTIQNTTTSRIKSYLTDDYITVEHKGVNPFNFKNYLDFIFFTNEFESIRIETDDRRFFVVENYTVPELSEKFEPTQLFDDLKTQLSSLVEIISQLDVSNWFVESYQRSKINKPKTEYIKETDPFSNIILSDIEDMMEVYNAKKNRYTKNERLEILKAIKCLADFRFTTNTGMALLIELHTEKRWSHRRIAKEFKKRGWIQQRFGKDRKRCWIEKDQNINFTESLSKAEEFAKQNL